MIIVYVICKTMREAKKIVLKTHPDKSRLEPKYFLFFSQAYKKIFQIYEFQNKSAKKQEDKNEYKDETHAIIIDKLFDFFSTCDEIWHAGDIGSIEVLHSLQKFKPTVAVFGNIDGTELRAELPLHQRHLRNGLDIWMTHIAGYPGNYDRKIKESLLNRRKG